MTQPQILVTVDQTGNSQVEVVGACGPGCQHLTAAFEQVLGRTVADQKKPEFHAQERQGQQQKAQQ